MTAVSDEAMVSMLHRGEERQEGESALQFEVRRLRAIAAKDLESAKMFLSHAKDYRARANALEKGE